MIPSRPHPVLVLSFGLLAACGSSGGPEEPPPLALSVADSVAVQCAHGVAIGSAGVAYATSICGNTLARIHYATPDGAAITTVGSRPAHVAVSPSGSTVFTTDQTAGTVSIVDAASGTLAGTVPLGGGREAYNVIVARDGARAFVTTNSDRLFAIDTRTRTIVDSAAVGSHSNGLALHPTRPTLYVSSIQQGVVVALDARTLAEVRRYQVGTRLQRIAVSPDGRSLYASDEFEPGFHILDLASGAVESVPVGTPAIGMAMRPQGDYAYVALANPGLFGTPGQVKVVDLRRRALHATIELGTNPRGIAIDRAGTVLVTDQSTGRVYIVRPD